MYNRLDYNILEKKVSNVYLVLNLVPVFNWGHFLNPSPTIIHISGIQSIARNFISKIFN